ncbi:unnamed protein product [Acanthoscelides obtectus]|uniref:Uncharacterized protein n=1 Tax=Acanthoscelides obtectus TaxID=200917 RepID=A0A9P0P698_ACAOB|nr:unnamed protein product [Acanthoscelides obtectus]CAK1673443.1 hypothetical protein AOBTE_LOCUS29341 [Acanthoscelides obtectus]
MTFPRKLFPKNAKRDRNKLFIKNEVIKGARLRGKEYLNYKGIKVNQRTIGEPCRCRSCCFDKIPEGERQEISDRFYALETKNEQDAYMQVLIECSEISRKRPRVDQNNAKPKSKSYKYYVSSSSGKHRVSKKTFISTHGVIVDRVRRLSKLLSMGKPPNDRRGKKKTRECKTWTGGQASRGAYSFISS